MRSAQQIKGTPRTIKSKANLVRSITAYVVFRINSNLDPFGDASGFSTRFKEAVGARLPLELKRGASKRHLFKTRGMVLSMETFRPIILTFVPYYVPGYKAGGPIRSIANLVDQLGDEFRFLIVTKDRDSGDSSPYPDIQVDGWNSVGKAKVFYGSERGLSFHALRRLLWRTSYDVLYLNSFFSSEFTIRPLLLRRLGLLPNRPILLAPRGEFSEGALQLKKSKKLAFVNLARVIRLYDGLVWQASSEYEVIDIRRVLGGIADRYVVTPNLPSVLPSLSASPDEAYRRNGPLRVVFLSRISRKKNLDFALRVLARVKEPVQFNIYGPADGDGYWHYCQKLISSLPNNIQVTYHGHVSHKEVPKIMKQNDLFFLPTLGENYGHAIAEALAAGTPVLISDATPWRNLEDAGVGWDLPLDSEEAFAERITEFAALSETEYLAMRQRTLAWAKSRLADPKVVEANRQMFLTVLARHERMRVVRT